MSKLHEATNPWIHGTTSNIYRLILLLAISATLVLLACSATAQAQGAYNQAPEDAPEESSPYDGGSYNVPEGERDNASPEAREFAEQMEPGQSENGQAQDEAAEQRENASPEEKQQAEEMRPEDGPIEEASDDGQKEMAEGTVDDSGGGGDDDHGMIEGMIMDASFGFLGNLFDRTVGFFANLLRGTGDMLADTAFGLPEPNQKILGVYEDYANIMKPAAAVALVIAAILKMVSDSNALISRETFQIFKRVAFFVVAITFFPNFIDLLTRITTDVGRAFYADHSVGGAFNEWLVRDFVGTLIPVDTIERNSDSSIARRLFSTGTKFGTSKLTLILLLILLIPVLALVVLLLAVTLVKNLLFYILVMVAPLALACYIVPGLQNVTSAWFRGLMASVAISILFALEVRVGSLAVENPEMFAPGGSWLPLITSATIAVLLWIMVKTVGAVYKWAFYSYQGRGLRAAEGMLIGKIFGR